MSGLSGAPAPSPATAAGAAAPHRVRPVIALAVAAQIALAIRFFGFLTGDDVEVLGEAFHRAVGYHYQPWDIRNLFVPDFLVTPFVFIASRFTRSIVLLIDAATLPFIALSACTIYLVYRLALKWTGDELAAFVAALLFAFHWIPLGFGSTVYPRTLSTACIVAAALLIDRFPFAAGLLAGVAVADRFSEIVFVSVIPSAARDPLRKGLLGLLGACVTIALTVGLYDWLTWGTPFSSVMKFAHLTLVEPEFTSRVKYQSPIWYLLNLHRWCAPTLLPLLFIGRRATRWSFIFIPLIALSLVRHKELRYLQGVIPFLMIAAGAGFAILYRRNRQWAAALLLISLIWDLHGLRYFARKSMPAVMAARALAADPHVHNVVLSQQWAFGDRLYFGDRIGLRDVGSPPRDLDAALTGADAAALYEADFDDPALLRTLRAHGFTARRTFRDGRARPVVLFTTSASGTSDRAHRSDRRRGS